MADGRRALRLVALPAAAAALAALAACQVLLGIDDPDTVPRPPDAAPAATVCGARPPPSKPDDPSGEEAGGLFFAIRTIAVLTSRGPVGYNIDHHCTSGDADLPCVGSPDDLDGGIDNAFEALMTSLPGTGSTDPLSEDLNAKIGTGRDSMFLGLYHYNQQSNDSVVELGMISAPVLVANDCDAAVPDDAGPIRPKWDGCDIWSLGDALVVDQLLPNAKERSYVSDGTLVAHFDDLALNIGVLSLHILDAILTSRVVKLPSGGWSLADGIIAGRLRADQFIQEVAELYVHGAGPSTPVCKVQGFPEQLRQLVCKARDLRVGDDNTAATCDGLSFGLSFEAESVAFGVPGDAAPGPVCQPIDTHCP